MIVSVRLNNYKAYGSFNEFSLKADMRIKKFSSSVYKMGNFNVVKSACIYGANNVGKTGLINAILSLKNVLSGKPANLETNLFGKNTVCSMGITFVYNQNIYSYDFKYDWALFNTVPRGFIYEELATIIKDEYGNEQRNLVFIKDVDNDRYEFKDNASLGELMSAVSNNGTVLFSINAQKYPQVDHYKSILTGFASTIDVLDMNNIPIDKTIEVLKRNDILKKKTVSLIKQADLEIDDYQYSPESMQDNNGRLYEVSIENSDNLEPQELALKKKKVEELLSLQSVHKGIAIPSMMFDSTGTKKMVALASYVIDALENGRTLVVDELDSSMHFKLSRAIVSLFNNGINDSAQLICAVQDISLLDCRKLFRKDQIWFANKGEGGTCLTSLSSYTAHQDNIRSETDVMEKYIIGAFGELPDPDLIYAILGGDDDE